MTTTTARVTRLMAPALAVSAAGAWLHNTLEGFPTMSGETMSALIPAAILAVAWWRTTPGATLWWVTVVWVLALNLVVGAILSVLPLPVFPFVPEQTVEHYLAHALYAVAQVPALVLLWRLRPASASPR